MADIKIKKKEKRIIKKFDRVANYTKKLKNNLVEVKEKSLYDSNDEETPTEYGKNKITEETRVAFQKGINTFNRCGKKSTKRTVRNAKEVTQKIKKKVNQNKIKKSKKTAKNIKRKLKVSKNAGNIAYKTVKGTVKTTAQSVKKAYQIANITAKTTIQGIKIGIKATISAIKAIILTTKALITAIISFGWVAIIIIVIICLIAMICQSPFGIFFSSEKGVGDKTMNSVINEINIEFANKITMIQKNTKHDEYEINSNKAEWKDILSIYSVLVNGKEKADIVTIDDYKINKLKAIFWEMNSINSKVQEIEKDIEITDNNGNIKIEKIKRKMLYIDIQGKSVEEMSLKYSFNEEQKLQLAELRKEEYNSMWTNVIYGTTLGSTDIVQVALMQLGNLGGEKFWSWYGYSNRVEWCACFVSWCANECRLY